MIKQKKKKSPNRHFIHLCCPMDPPESPSAEDRLEAHIAHLRNFFDSENVTLEELKERCDQVKKCVDAVQKVMAAELAKRTPSSAKRQKVDDAVLHRRRQYSDRLELYTQWVNNTDGNDVAAWFSLYRDEFAKHRPDLVEDPSLWAADEKEENVPSKAQFMRWAILCWLVKYIAIELGIVGVNPEEFFKNLTLRLNQIINNSRDRVRQRAECALDYVKEVSEWMSLEFFCEHILRNHNLIQLSAPSLGLLQDLKEVNDSYAAHWCITSWTWPQKLGDAFIF